MLAKLIPFHFDLNVDFLKNVNQCAKEFGYCLHFCFFYYNHIILNLLPDFYHNFALFRFILNLPISVLIMTSVKKRYLFLVVLNSNHQPSEFQVDGFHQISLRQNWEISFESKFVADVAVIISEHDSCLIFHMKLKS